MDALTVQLFVGLYAIVVGLPSATAETVAPARKPLSSYAQVVFGVVLVVITFFHVALVK